MWREEGFFRCIGDFYFCVGILEREGEGVGFLWEEFRVVVV